MPSDTSRRAFLTTAGAAVVTLGVVGPARAELTLAQARQLIDRVVADINRIINSGKPAQGMYDDFAVLLDRYADVPVVARSAVGPIWRRMSADQQRRFIQAFKLYLARKYGKRFREFVGGRLVVRDTRRVKTFYEVVTTAVLKGEEPFEVRFLVSDKSGQPRFFNIIIEGVNMLASERAEIQALIRSHHGDIEAVIRELPRLG